LSTLRPPRPTLFPYTTLFRSQLPVTVDDDRGVRLVACEDELDGTAHGLHLGVLEGELAVSRRIARSEQQLVALAQRDVELLGERSEEHTSELQSLAYLVCRLL